MNWLDKLEKKLGRFAIPNLTVYLLAGYVIGFGVMYVMPELLTWLTLEPAPVSYTHLFADTILVLRLKVLKCG